jgi:hypothetical protein
VELLRVLAQILRVLCQARHLELELGAAPAGLIDLAPQIHLPRHHLLEQRLKDLGLVQRLTQRCRRAAALLRVRRRARRRVRHHRLQRRRRLLPRLRKHGRRPLLLCCHLLARRGRARAVAAPERLHRLRGRRVGLGARGDDESAQGLRLRLAGAPLRGGRTLSELRGRRGVGSGLQLCAEQGRELGRIAHVQRQRRLERAHLHAHRRLARRLPRLRGGGDARLLRTP